MKERYQSTWPDKKKSVVLASVLIAKTLPLTGKSLLDMMGQKAVLIQRI